MAITACCVSPLPQSVPLRSHPSLHTLLPPQFSRAHPHPESSGKGSNPKARCCTHSSWGQESSGKERPCGRGRQSFQSVLSPPGPTFPGRSGHGSGWSRGPAGPGERLKPLKVEPDCSVAGPRNNWGVTSFCLSVSLPTG